MSKLLELKIRNYEKIIHDHNRANNNYYHEILALVQQNVTLDGRITKHARSKIYPEPIRILRK